MRARRYIIAEGLRERRPAVIEMLFQTNDAFNAVKRKSESQPDVKTLLTNDFMLRDTQFTNYVRSSNLAYVAHDGSAGFAHARSS